jgi:hypothetical protein
MLPDRLELWEKRQQQNSCACSQQYPAMLYSVELFSALIDFLHVMQQQPFILGDSLRHREAATPHVRHGRPIQCWQFNLAFRASHPEQCAWSALFDSIQ